ncbi:hypothetical protein [Frankia sp. R43]|uniref:hypothetical protein n=1 Tax=Frankia sp. R43 TaxID=269536 RepID=UPI00128F3542|nr:hypothetical protein [Frankia sp. R43]
MSGMDRQPEPEPECAENVALRLMELRARAALGQMEAVARDFVADAASLPLVPLERAAFGEKVETIAAELRWLAERVGQVAERVECGDGPRPGAERSSAALPRRIPRPRRCGGGTNGAGR